MNQLTILLSFFLFIPLSFISQSNSASPKEIRLVFKPNKSRVTLKHKKQLEAIRYELKNGNDVFVYPVSAYSSNSSISSATNHRTTGEPISVYFSPNSRKQANAVAMYLHAEQVGEITIERNFAYSIVGPSVRIKIAAQHHKEPKEEVKKPKAKEKQIPFKEYFPEKKSQYFTVNPKKDTLIEGEEGTKLFFASGSLLCDEPVQIELKEYYKSSDFLKAELQTVSNGKLLFTGGTIYLDARKKSDLKEQVKINPSRGINTEFTNGNDDPEMEVFLKDETARETNWIRDMKRTWRFTRNYMLNKTEVYKTFIFNSPNEYQEFVTSGTAKAFEEEWYNVLRAIALEKWNAARKAAMEKRRAELEEIQKNDEAIVSRLTINELGFINCDKFYNKETKPLEIFADKSMNATYYAILSGEDKGILKGRGSDKIRFGNLPVDQPVTIVGISLTSKEKYIFKKRVSTINEAVGEVTLIKASEDELESLLSSINQ